MNSFQGLSLFIHHAGEQNHSASSSPVLSVHPRPSSSSNQRVHEQLRKPRHTTPSTSTSSNSSRIDRHLRRIRMLARQIRAELVQEGMLVLMARQRHRRARRVQTTRSGAQVQLRRESESRNFGLVSENRNVVAWFKLRRTLCCGK
jgi:hypothetical protein